MPGNLVTIRALLSDLLTLGPMYRHISQRPLHPQKDRCYVEVRSFSESKTIIGRGVETLTN